MLWRYFKLADVRFGHIIISLVLSLAMASVEGISLALIMPLAEAMSETNFDFLSTSWAFGWVLHLLPAELAASPRRDAYITLLLLGLILAGRLLKLALDYFAKLYRAWRNETYLVRVRTATFSRILSFGRQYFDRQAIGRIDTELGWSSSVVSLLGSFEGILTKVVQLGIKLAIAVSISIPLTIASLLAVPVVQVLLRSMRRGMDRIAREGAEAQRQMRTEVLDILTTIPLVKAYSQERQATESFETIARHSADVELRQARLGSLYNPITEGVILFIMLGAYGLSLWLSADFNPGDLAKFGTFLLITQQALPDYLALAGLRIQLITDGPRLEALASLFDDDGKFVVQAGERPFPGLRKEISVRSLHFGYHEGQPVFHGLDATFPAGSMTAVVGRSGSGKTTLASLLCRFYDCPPDTIFIDGVDIREYALPSLHERMALVSQDVWLLNRTVRDNLTWGLEVKPSDENLWEALADVDLEALVRSLSAGLGTFIGDRGVQLSGGQRQRLALARTLLREPEVLILDEATSSLDSLAERHVEAAVERRATGRTLIVIAHRLSTIRAADHILVLDQGRLVESGTWDELIARGGHFAELHQAQEREDLDTSDLPARTILER